MAQIITANELKTKGVTLLNNETSDGSEVIITVHGKSKYVVLPIEKYNYLRECELDTALLESRKDLKDGKFVKESVEKHLKRITRG
jgi:prevent-host-death family protein